MKKLILTVIPAIFLWGATNAQTALSFDGVDDYVNVGTNFSLTSYTKEVWIKWDGITGQNNAVSGDLTNKHAFWATGANMRAGHEPPFSTVADPDDLVPGEWNHFAVTYDGNTGEMVLYKNGEEIVRNLDDPGFVITNVYLAAFDAGPTNLNLLGGDLDDVRIWDNVRTADEIRDNYQTCLAGTEEGLVAFYEMGDGEGSDTLTDLTGNGNDGLLINMDINTAWVDNGVDCNDSDDSDDSDDEEIESIITLTPIEDAYLQYGSRYNTNIVRVEKNRRTGYLMFDTSNITGTIVEAKLKFTVTSDPGYGNLNINLGSSNNWTENNISNSNKPNAGILLASINENFNIGDTKTIDLQGLDLFNEDQLSLVLNMTSGNDFAFASKENNGVAKAELIITVIASDSHTDNDFATNNLPPLEDAYLQYGSGYNTNIVRVEKNRRTGYLMFDTSNITGTIVEAKLKFTVTSDPGYGNLNINLGSSNNWTENNISNSNKPNAGILLASINENFNIGDTKTIDLQGLDSFNEDQLSLVLNMTSGNDFAFASKEESGVQHAELIITTMPSNNSGDRMAQFSESIQIQKQESELSINSFDLYPNPAKTNINVRFNHDSLKLISRIDIVDGYGRIYNVNLNNTNNLNIDVAKLKQGLYYIRFNIKASNEVITKVFVKK